MCESEAFQKPKLERSVEAEHSFFLEMKRKQTSSDERLYTETGLFVWKKLTLEGIIAADRARAPNLQKGKRTRTHSKSS